MKRRRQLAKGNPIEHLINRTEVRVRFNEVDSLRYVWHGHYVKYFEDGREAFGQEFELGYMNVYNQGFATPLVRVEVNYKYPLYYGDEAIIETQFVDCEAAKIIFRFKVYRKSDMVLVADGETIQVFTDLEENLSLTNPEFFVKWKEKYVLTEAERREKGIAAHAVSG